MTNEELQAILQMLAAILQELKKANQRPLYIVVNNTEALKDFVRQFENATKIPEPGPFTYGERWLGELVRYEVHDRFSRTWIHGMPVETGNWRDGWDELFRTEAEAQAEIRTLNARYRKEGE